MSSWGPTSRTERNGTFRYSFLSFQNTCIALKQSKKFNPTVSPWVCLHFVSTLQSELNWLQSAVWTLTSQLSRLSLWQLMVRFLSVCLSAWHIYTPCVTINLLHYTHTHTHTHTHTDTSSRSLALQHAKWKSTLRMIWISIWISDQISAVTSDQTSKHSFSDFTLKRSGNSTPWDSSRLHIDLFLWSSLKQHYLHRLELANFNSTYIFFLNKTKSHRTLPAAPVS